MDDLATYARRGLQATWVRARHARQGSPEYSEIVVVAESEIPRFAASLGAALAPVSRALLERRGLISAKPATGPGASR